MVGGTVIETIDTGERVWINVRGREDDRHKTLGMYLERTAAARSVSVGDSVWWLNLELFWTPKGRPFTDYVLKRTSMSGVPRPGTEPVEDATGVHA